MPSAELLSFPFTIAKVLHATGLTEEIDLSELDEMGEGPNVPGETAYEARVSSWLMATA